MNMIHTPPRQAGRPSIQIRADWPDAGEPPHPRAVEMAETIRSIAALGNGVSPADLFAEGFNGPELSEYFAAAEKLATQLSTRQVAPQGDNLATIKDKAKEAWPNRMPEPPLLRDSQAVFQDWGRYCAARSAYKIDRWTGQRERCIDTLSDFLDRLPISASDRKAVIRAVGETLSEGAAH